MIKYLLLLAFLFQGTSFTNSPKDTNAAVMTFEFETHNFGDIREGDEAKIDFVFTNTGNEKLIITNVIGSCECTVPTWAQEPVLPGEKSAITVEYNTEGKSGKFSKSITISSNATEDLKRLFIKGNVLPSSDATE